MRIWRSPARASGNSSSGIGRPSSPYAQGLSKDLRYGRSWLFTRRRRVFGLSLASAVSLGVVALYQAGILYHLPDPPGGVFDSDEVDASGEAYSSLSTPDAALGIATYALTAALASCAAVPAALPKARLAWRHPRTS